MMATEGSTDGGSVTDSLHAQIQALTDLHARLSTLRGIPPSLLAAPATLRAQFHQLREIGDHIRSDPIQEALRSARDSLKADSTQLNSNPRREYRKRRRLHSPDSPKPYIAPEPRGSSLFPLGESSDLRLRVEDLPDYVRDFNSRKKDKAKLHLWRRTRGTPENDDRGLTVLRFMIADVMTVYMTLTPRSDDGMLLVESVTAFAPRERKSPHSQSDYVVYQSLSQQLAKMVQSHPSVPVESLLVLAIPPLIDENGPEFVFEQDALCAYEGLFVERCGVCERVLAGEGHVPPVVRTWIENNGWEARHVGC